MHIYDILKEAVERGYNKVEIGTRKITIDEFKKEVFDDRKSYIMIPNGRVYKLKNNGHIVPRSVFRFIKEGNQNEKVLY